MKQHWKKANENIKELTDKLKDPASGLYKDLITKDTKIKEYASQIAVLQNTVGELYQKLFKAESNIHAQVQEAVKVSVAANARITAEQEATITQLNSQIEKLTKSGAKPMEPMDTMIEVLTQNEKLQKEKENLEKRLGDSKTEYDKLKLQFDAVSKELAATNLTLKEQNKTIQMNEELLNELLKHK